MMKTVKRSATLRWTTLLLGGSLSAAAVGGASAESVSSIQRSYDRSAGVAEAYAGGVDFDGRDSAPVRFRVSEARPGSCNGTFLQRRYGLC